MNLMNDCIKEAVNLCWDARNILIWARVGDGHIDELPSVVS